MRKPALPHVVVPTTAGTGSEVTNAAVIHHVELGRKVYVVDDKLIPPVAILDPLLSTGLPAALTTSTGMDAMTHAIESVVGKRSNLICDGLALQAIRLIAETLPVCVERPEDLEARVTMLMAAAMAGWSVSIAGAGLVHGMSHSLGALCRVPHGTANAILLPHVMRYNLEVAGAKLAQVGQALGCQGDSAALARGAADAIAALLVRTGHPTTLSAVGVKRSDLAACAQLALTDDVTTGNPRVPHSAQEIIALFEQAL
jgi:alcohol dehydrogenase class IV